MSKRIHPEDPRVTAYVLGELPGTERAEIERAALLNPALQKALRETEHLSGLLGSVLGDRRLELGADRRDAIRRAGRHPNVRELPSARPMRRWGRAAAVLSAAAALVVAVLWGLQQIPVKTMESGNGTLAETEQETMMRILLAPVEASRVVRGPQVGPARPAEDGGGGPQDITSDPQHVAMTRLLHENPEAFFRNVQEAAGAAAMRDLAKLPELVDNAYVSTRDVARAAVPIVSGGASFPMVERFVRGEKRLPPLNLVRIEELINHVIYQDEGEAEAGGIKLSAELVRCPWDDELLLLGVLLRNDSDEILPMASALSLNVQPDVVRSHRLVGYAEARAGENAGASVLGGLPPGWSNFVLFELIPAKAAVFTEPLFVARIDLVVGTGENRRGLFVPVNRPPRDWINASGNFKTAGVLAGYGLLLRDSPHRKNLDAPMLTRLATQALEEATDGELRQREALQLVMDSQDLLEQGR